MKVPSVIVGVIMAGLLLALMALARLLVPGGEVPDLEIREIDISALPEPPPPPPEEPPPDDAPPPPPALTEISQVPDPSRVPVPKARMPMDVTMPVDPFFTDVEPAPLPKPEPVVRQTRPTPTPTPRPTQTTRPAPPAPVAKSHYQVSELDGKPRLLRHGSAAFPPALARRGVASGTVVFEVELSTGGGVSIRRTVSASHPELVPAARRVASSARFTAPTRRGQPVKAIMRWPITIRK